MEASNQSLSHAGGRAGGRYNHTTYAGERNGKCNWVKDCYKSSVVL